MKYYLKQKKNETAQTVVNMEKPQEVNEPYQEFVPSGFEWILPQDMVKRADKLDDMTKPNKSGK